VGDATALLESLESELDTIASGWGAWVGGTPG